MSATRDKSQKVAFVYTNFYELYRNGLTNKENNTESEQDALKGVVRNKILKADSDLTKLNVKAFAPVEFKSLPKTNRAQALDDLKSNLGQLSQLHSKLKFMLKEIEELVKE